VKNKNKNKKTTQKEQPPVARKPIDRDEWIARAVAAAAMRSDKPGPGAICKSRDDED